MKYLVNRETKEHMHAPDGFLSGNWHGWHVVEADAEGWIKWDGGERPLPDDCLCDTLWSDDEVSPRQTASNWRWNDSNLIAYRPILDKPDIGASPRGEGKTGVFEPESERKPNSDAFNAEIKAEQHRRDLLARLKSAHEAAQSIPDLLAELREALGPELLRMLVDAPQPASDPEPDMSDWRNWREGDRVVRNDCYPADFWMGSESYEIETEDDILVVRNDNGTSYQVLGDGFFRFHSRP